MTRDRPQRVLFVCTHNAARSQMAEGIGRQFADRNISVFSAGDEPTRIDPRTVAVMKEIGINIENQRAKHVREFSGKQFDYVVTLCDQAAERCPFFPGPARRVHFSFPDPAAAMGSAEDVLRVFRKVRDQILGKIGPFLEALTCGRKPE